jgi:hypothetical protein
MMLAALPLITLTAALLGAIWMGFIAYKKGDHVWSLACLLTLGIVAIIYGFRNLKTCLFPTILCLLGVAGRILAEVMK